MLSVDRRDVLYLYIYALFHGLIYLSIPLGIQAIISLITTNQVTSSWVVLVGLIATGVLVSGLLQMVQMAITEGIQQRIFLRAALEFAYRIPRFRLAGLKGTYPPELVNRFFDTLTIQKGLSKILLDFSTSTLQVFFGLVVLGLYHPVFILFGFSLVFLIYMLFRFLGPAAMRTSIKESTHKYEVVHWLEEVARAMGTFKLAGRTNLPIDKTDELVVKYIGARRAHFKVLLSKYGGLVAFKVLVITALLLIGGVLVINRQMNIGQFVAAEIIILMVMNAVEKLMMSIDTVYDVLTALEKLGSVTDIELETEEGVEYRVRRGVPNMEIQLVDVVSYNKPMHEKPVVNLFIPGGQKVFLTGTSGSGRSSLMAVIAALDEPISGNVLYDGVAGETLSFESLRLHIGDSLEEEHLFSGSLRENMTLGREGISEDQLEKVMDSLGLTEWFKTLSMGLNTQLLPSGKELPDNIIKRIILARGVCSQPKLLVLEDFLVNMPQKNKAELVHALIKEPWTMVVAGNDALFASMCDRVLVMDNGAIIADGKFNDVIQDQTVRDVFFGME